MSDAMSAVAAELTAQLLMEAASNGDNAAAEVINREIAEAAQPVVAQPVAASAPVEQALQAAPAVAVAEAPAPVEVPDFSPKLSDELKDLLDEPDFEEEAAEEVAAALEADEYGDEYLDPEVAKKLRTLEKRNKFLEERVVEAGRKKWVSENLDAYPLLKQHFPGEVKAITASSRRAFAREAAKLNAKYESALGPVLKKLEEAKQAITAGAVATAREEVAAAWGKPASDTLPPIGSAQQAALAKARNAGSLKDSIKVLMEDKPLL